MITDTNITNYWYPTYEGALVAAGAIVHACKEFGSYQGEWYAKVTYNGVTGWVSGYSGSCPGCDEIQAELCDLDGYGEICPPNKSFEEWWKYQYVSDVAGIPLTRESWECAKLAYMSKYAEIGSRYLADGLMTQEEAESQAGENSDWDSTAAEMVEFVRANSNP